MHHSLSNLLQLKHCIIVGMPQFLQISSVLVVNKEPCCSSKRGLCGMDEDGLNIRESIERNEEKRKARSSIERRVDRKAIKGE